jgi:beta-phosphoglucomutase-like phosphatase (HAD superfamily)
VGNHHVKEKHRPKASARRPRERTCLNKKCGRRYHSRRWNQRYCQDPECLREVRRWQAAQRQANRRDDADVRAEHARAESARREQAKSTPQVAQTLELTPARGHAAVSFFPFRYATGRAATNTP